MEGNIAQSVLELLADNDPTAMTEREFLGARFDKGLAWVNYPVGAGGLGAPRHCQDDLEDRLVVAGAVRPQAQDAPPLPSTGVAVVFAEEVGVVARV